MPCDKCGQPVQPDNDSALLKAAVTGQVDIAMEWARHLYPVEGCEGSPWCVRLLEGDAERDIQPAPDWVEAWERLRAAVLQSR